MASNQSPEGVCFPAGGDGERSTSATGRAIFADSVREIDPDLAARIEHTRDWRSGYLTPLRDIIVSATSSPAAALSVAEQGLSSAHRRFRMSRNGVEQSLAEAMAMLSAPGLASVDVRGHAAREKDLSVPYRGKRLFGAELRTQIDTWVRDGIAEPGFAVAMHAVLDNPDWLDLTDVDVAILGASAEMGPTRSLLRWGARIHAVDLPRPTLWEKLIQTTRSTAGAMRIPIALDAEGQPPFVVGGLLHPDDDINVAQHAGVNLLTHAPEIRTWLDVIDQPFVLGTYAYADGATHALLSVAADAIADDLINRRDDITLAFLATPTDVFMVPIEAVTEAQRRWDARGFAALFQAPLRMAGQFEPNYPDVYVTPEGREIGINDSLIPQQGPNYALAKRIQRWRALYSRAQGVPVSLNLAPATRTQSVIKNRALSAAYAGAGRFGVEIFEPATSTVLMAALLVHDLRNPASVANPDTPLANPMDQFSALANHGGLWRTAYAPRSVLGIAALMGLLDSRS
jgi:hypothetical protein